MSLVEAAVANFISYNPKYKLEWSPTVKFNNKDTYMLVFSINQIAHKKILDTQKDKTITVLYEAPAANNKYHGNDSFNGNTLVIFEKKDGKV